MSRGIITLAIIDAIITLRSEGWSDMNMLRPLVDTLWLIQVNFKQMTAHDAAIESMSASASQSICMVCAALARQVEFMGFLLSLSRCGARIEIPDIGALEAFDHRAGTDDQDNGGQQG